MLKTSKTLGLAVILAVYILATAAAIPVFLVMGDGVMLWVRVLVADIVATVVVYISSLIFGNASVYDAYWSVAPMIIVPLVLAYTGAFNVGTVILLALIEAWGARLTGNWIYTFKNLEAQDWRYDDIKNKSGKFYPLYSFLGIQLMPTLIVFTCMFPIIALSSEVMALSIILEFNAFTAFGFLALVLGIILETVPDLQKHIFRIKGNSGVVNTGLWKYGRHPNYLGEILIWWGVYFTVLALAPALWWTVFGTVINTLLFIFISIPLAEKQSLLRHGEAWDEYKQNTRLLI